MNERPLIRRDGFDGKQLKQFVRLHRASRAYEVRYERVDGCDMVGADKALEQDLCVARA